MYRLYLILAAAVISGAIGVGNALASDGGSMDTLSAYLHAHRLPLVEARLITNESGERSVLLYGFVATQYGKHDAEDQARDFLDDPDIAIINRIRIRPELLTLGRPANNANSATSPQEASDAIEDGSADSSGATADFPDAIGDQQAYADQERNDELLMSNGAAVGGIPLALAIFGSGAIFPPINPPIFPRIYRNGMPPVSFGPPVVYSAPPPVIVIRPTFSPPPTAYTGFPSAGGLGGPSPFPAGPAPMFPATGGLPPFATTVNPAFPGSFATHGAFGGGGFGGAFGNSGFGGGLGGGRR